nr:hypothetical protein [Candidatus Dormibacteraeota bacterium]
AFLLEGRLAPLALAGFAGLLIATLGMATEWAWTSLFYPFAWQPAMLGRMWLPALAAIVAAVLGLGFGRTLAGNPARPRLSVMAVALVLIAGLFAVPLTRGGEPLKATLTAAPAGPQHAALDRYGQASYEQDMNVQVALDRPAAVRGADWFTIIAWQGGDRRVIRLNPTGSGRYQADAPVPTGGTWKSIVFLASGDRLVSVPIYFPPDPEYGSPGYQATGESVRSFAPSPRLITSESHGGPPGVAIAAYTALWLTLLAWLVSLALAAVQVARRAGAGAREAMGRAAEAEPERRRSRPALQ